MTIINHQFPKSQVKKWIKLDLNKVYFIVLHHIEADKASVDTINVWHRFKGWAGGFGYNEYIRKDGTCYIGRGDHIGAQCKGMNSKSYGIALEGDFKHNNQMTIAQFNTLIARIKHHKERFPNMVKVKPHNYFVDTECPGAHFPLREIYNTLEENIEIMNLENENTLLKDENKVLKDSNINLEKQLARYHKKYDNLYEIHQDKVKELQKLRKSNIM